MCLVCFSFFNFLSKYFFSFLDKNLLLHVSLFNLRAETVKVKDIRNTKNLHRDLDECDHRGALFHRQRSHLCHHLRRRIHAYAYYPTTFYLVTLRVLLFCSPPTALALPIQQRWLPTGTLMGSCSSSSSSS